jgi:hypothetical protein
MMDVLLIISKIKFINWLLIFYEIENSDYNKGYILKR